MSRELTTPEHRKEAVQDLIRVLRGARKVILTTHLNADGDGVGSEAALLSLLTEAGVEAWIVNPTPFPDLFRFLVPDPSRVLDAAGEDAGRRCREADLCVVLDTGEKSRIGRVKPLIDHLPLAIIDHHPPGDDALVGTSLRDPSGSATGELIFDLVAAWGGPWTRAILEGLYVAILTDTGSFRFSNATPRAHRVAAELIERGAEPDVLYRKVYGHIPIRRVRLLEGALSTLEVAPGGGVAWMTVPEVLFRNMACTSEDLDGMVDLPRELEGVEVGLLFREIESGQVKVSLRSNAEVDVNRVAREFGGGGHVRASGALIPGTLEEVRGRVVERMVAEVDATRARAAGSRSGISPLEQPGTEPSQGSGVDP